MIILIEDPKREFYHLVNEARDALNGLQRVGGPAYTYFKLAEKLREITPRFKWNGNDAKGFIRDSKCRFYASPFALRSKKQNARDVLTLDDILAINAWASQELKPILQKIKDTHAPLDVPPELRVSTGENELVFIFQRKVSPGIAYDRAFLAEAMGLLEHLYKRYEGKASPSSKLPPPQV